LPGPSGVSSSRQPPTPTSWPSSRRSIGPRARARSSTPSSQRPPTASRCPCSSRSRPRFDEQANIAGRASSSRPACHVVYGSSARRRTASCLVVRRSGTARALLPHRHGQLQPEHRAPLRGCRPAHRRPGVGADLTAVQPLTGYSPQDAYRRCCVAPRRLRSGMIDRIEREIAPPRTAAGAGSHEAQRSSTRQSSTRSTASRPACASTRGPRDLRLRPASAD
jgi:hypothetical protein